MVSRVISVCVERWGPKGLVMTWRPCPIKGAKEGRVEWRPPHSLRRELSVLSHPRCVCVVLQHNKNSQWCQEHFLNYKGLVRAATVREQLKKLLVKFQVPKKSSEGKNKLPLLMTLLSLPCGVAFLAFSGRAVWGNTVYSGPTLGSCFEWPALVKSCMWREHVPPAKEVCFHFRGLFLFKIFNKPWQHLGIITILYLIVCHVVNFPYCRLCKKNDFYVDNIYGHSV